MAKCSCGRDVKTRPWEADAFLGSLLLGVAIALAFGPAWGLAVTAAPFLASAAFTWKHRRGGKDA